MNTSALACYCRARQADSSPSEPPLLSCVLFVAATRKVRLGAGADTRVESASKSETPGCLAGLDHSEWWARAEEEEVRTRLLRG